MNKSDKFTGLFFLVITAILIAITFFLFLLQEASAPVVPEYTVPDYPPQTVTEPVVAEVTIQTASSSE